MAIEFGGAWRAVIAFTGTHAGNADSPRERARYVCKYAPDLAAGVSPRRDVRYRWSHAALGGVAQRHAAQDGTTLAPKGACDADTVRGGRRMTKMMSGTVRRWSSAAALLVAASAWEATGTQAETTTTTTTTTVTTTTTPAGGGMFSAVDDGLAALTAEVDALGTNVKVKGLLQRELGHMQKNRALAETRLNAGRRPQALVALRSADHWLIAFISRIKSATVKHSMGAAQTSLLATALQTRTSLRTVLLAVKQSH